MDNKITRICWNSHNWASPSGSEGKSLDKDSLEHSQGYSHEEWLGDHAKKVDGFKYAFLPAINTHNNRFQGNKWNIWLYTLKDNRKICFGYIKKAICLSVEAAQTALDVYQKEGWLEEMQAQVSALGRETTPLKDLPPLSNFNIKFKPKDLVWLKEPKDISHHYANHRYVLMDLVDPDFKQEHLLEDDLSFDLTHILEAPLTDNAKIGAVNNRIGQGIFRRNVIELWQSEHCAVTLVDISCMLTATHIKSWEHCTDDEKLDGANGLMLCAHVSQLFSNHLASFTPKNGRYVLEVSSTVDAMQLKGLGIEKETVLNTAHLDFDSLERFKRYIHDHNQRFIETNTFYHD
ncbi:HNH endonuclease signature motif containing protein [Shewanella surugensis]|uniref:HNH endonuclease n=1 Tax=Shewanella surugensis TaxID=212020 RepID=A0ABT0L7A7_9GAMM|nr:HNH endonuclease signature motif containing protein [Shewanella surugensis]MCL1123553.1 HNH endonuclease [Shewanella surugensis]